MLHTATQSPGMSTKDKEKRKLICSLVPILTFCCPLSAICKRWELWAPFCQLTGFIYKCLKWGRRRRGWGVRRQKGGNNDFIGTCRRESGVLLFLTSITLVVIITAGAALSSTMASGCLCMCGCVCVCVCVYLWEEVLSSCVGDEA